MLYQPRADIVIMTVTEQEMTAPEFRWPSDGSATAQRAQTGVLRLCLLLVMGASLFAQDPFDIHVYQYETLAPGGFTLEQHMNYVGSGTKVFDGAVAPTNDQLHMSYELTAGVTEFFSMGVMELNAVRPGGPGLEYAGWRLLPHFDAPKSWRLPLDLGLVAGFAFQKTTYEENSRRVEIRPILGKRVGRLQTDFNPVFERDLHGPGVGDGWKFEPSVRLGYEANKRITPSIEYYSSLGPLSGFLPLDRQIHLFFPGADIKLRENILWSVGVGVAATPAGSQLIYKSRLAIEFGRREK